MSAGAAIAAAAVPALVAMLERLIRDGLLDPRAIGLLGERHPELAPELPRLRIAAYETAKLRATEKVKGTPAAQALFREMQERHAPGPIAVATGEARPSQSAFGDARPRPDGARDLAEYEASFGIDDGDTADGEPPGAA